MPRPGGVVRAVSYMGLILENGTAAPLRERALGERVAASRTSGPLDSSGARQHRRGREERPRAAIRRRGTCRLLHGADLRERLWAIVPSAVHHPIYVHI